MLEYNAIGMVELKSVTKGIITADAMIKGANVNLVKCFPICPGKYIIIVRGRIGAVKAAVEQAKELVKDDITDVFMLGNPHSLLFAALDRNYEKNVIGALGIIETRTIPSILMATDTATKTAQVQIVELRMAREIGGKAYALLTGDLDAVETAVLAGCQSIEQTGSIVDYSVIPNPDPKLKEYL